MKQMQLKILGMKLLVHLGVPESERLQTQSVYLDLILNLRDDTAAQSDNIADTVCYATLYEKLQTFCNGEKFHLIEHLAARLYSHLELIYSGICLESLTLHKNPPLEQIKEAAITITREPK